MADVVIVGAGPVGLWTALQIKKRMPRAAVVMYPSTPPGHLAAKASLRIMIV